MARRATLIRSKRNEAESSSSQFLLLDAGASLLNDREPAKRTRGQSSVEYMNLVGYNAMALGLLDVNPIGLEQLRQRMAEAQFPILSANAYLSGTRELVTKPYVVLELADHRVGILGLTEKGATREVVASDPLQAARERLPELQRQADIVIVLSHAGLEVDRQIAEELPGIDLVVGGFGQPLPSPILVEGAGTLIVHADTASPGHAGENVGVAYLNFDRGGRLSKHQWQRKALDGFYSEDSEIQQWLGKFSQP